jgi:hypothetical protein
MECRVSCPDALETAILDDRGKIMTIPGHPNTLGIFPSAVIILVSWGCGEAPEARSESVPMESQEPVAVFQITYGDEVTLQESLLVGEEVVGDVDCTVYEYSYNPPALRLSSDGATSAKLLSGKIWISNATGEWIRIETEREIMGDTVNVELTNVFRFNPPLGVGQSWFFERDARLLPERRLLSRTRYRGEVTSREEIVVPAGTFTCFRIDLSVVAADGVKLEEPQVQSVMWITVDTHEEIKRESYGTWGMTETAELVASVSVH